MALVHDYILLGQQAARERFGNVIDKTTNEGLLALWAIDELVKVGIEAACPEIAAEIADRLDGVNHGVPDMILASKTIRLWYGIDRRVAP